jgi:cyanophycinase
MLRTAPRLLLALLGSGEFEPWTSGFERELLEAATGDGSVVIVATASAPEGPTYHEWLEMGLDHYADAGVVAHVADVRGREDAHRDDVVAEIERASMVFMSGGDASYLAMALAGSPAWDAMRDLVERGGAIAGCSAGAMVLGEAAPPCMLRDLRLEDVGSGLALLPSTWIWPHWSELPAEVRAHLLGLTPDDATTLLIDERTATLARGETWTTVGDGAARWFDDAVTARSGEDLLDAATRSRSEKRDADAGAELEIAS